MALPSNAVAEVAVTVILVAATAATFQVSYALFSGLLTGTVVLLVGFVSGGSIGIALARLIDTLIGGALALVAFAAWPTWSSASVPAALSGLARALAGYLEEALGGITGTSKLDTERLRGRAREARLARAEAGAAVERSLAEPPGRRVDMARTQAILAATSRISLASHALRTEVEASRQGKRWPQAAGLARELVRTLENEAEALATMSLIDEPAEAAAPALTDRGGLGRLRQLHDELEASLGAGDMAPGGAVGGADDGAAWLLAETDELVDAVDTLHELLLPGWTEAQKAVTMPTAGDSGTAVAYEPPPGNS